MAKIHVKELNENITPYVMASSPPVLTVGYRCMHKGYSFIWPCGKDPYSVRPDGWVTHLKVRGYIPYLVPGSPDCQPQKPRGKLQFCCSSLHIDGTRRALPGDELAHEVVGGDDEFPPGDVLSEDDTLTTRRSGRRPKACTICLRTSLKTLIVIHAVV
ncbi:MAG: hypothetical protein ACKPKO_08410, partial [Candidatus Fonsibacter sp.]